MLTSNGVDDEAFVKGDLYALFADARQRGVKIYIYNIGSKDTDSQTSHFFNSYDIAYDNTFTHAKLFAVDKSLVTIGSYNWLSKDDSWENASLRLSGTEEYADLIDLIWKDLKYYRHQQFGNLHKIRQYESDPLNTGAVTWALDRS